MALLSISTSNVIRAINMASLPPHKAPPFSEDAEMVEMAQRMTLEGTAEDKDDKEKQPGWDITLAGSDERIEACAMGIDGAVIVGVGSRGSVWIWVAES